VFCVLQRIGIRRGIPSLRGGCLDHFGDAETTVTRILDKAPGDDPPRGLFLIAANAKARVQTPRSSHHSWSSPNVIGRFEKTLTHFQRDRPHREEGPLNPKGAAQAKTAQPMKGAADADAQPHS
jgi:hypothetical protein